MPELPEVETVARGVNQHIAGARVKGIELRRPEIVYGCPVSLSGCLCGRLITEVVRQGKQILIRTDRPYLSVIIHLGMTGRLFVTQPATAVEIHTHLRVWFHGLRQELRFVDPRRFGGIWVLDSKRETAGKWVGRRVPPVAADPLRISLRHWQKLLAERRRQIKPLLLDQEPISGLGNIYCDESLHRAGIHPLQRACNLTAGQLRRLYGAVRRVLNEAIAAGGSSVDDYRNADNEQGWFQIRHRVYGRTGRPCRRCGMPIERIVVCGRGTHFCPRCQALTTGDSRDAAV